MPLAPSSLSLAVSALSWRTARYGFPLAALSQLLPASQRMKGNEQTIESLAHRVKALADALLSPVSEGDVKEQKRRRTLEQ